MLKDENEPTSGAPPDSASKSSESVSQTSDAGNFGIAPQTSDDATAREPKTQGKNPQPGGKDVKEVVRDARAKAGTNA